MFPKTSFTPLARTCPDRTLVVFAGTGKIAGSIPKTDWRHMYPLVRPILEKILKTSVNPLEFLISVRIGDEQCLVPPPDYYTIKQRYHLFPRSKYSSIMKFDCSMNQLELMTSIPQIEVLLFMNQPQPLEVSKIYMSRRRYGRVFRNDVNSHPIFKQMFEAFSKHNCEDAKDLNRAYDILNQAPYYGITQFHNAVTQTVRYLGDHIGKEFAVRLTKYIYYLQDTVDKSYASNVPYNRDHLKHVHEFIGWKYLDEWKSLLLSQSFLDSQHYSLSKCIYTGATKSPPKNIHVHPVHGNGIQCILKPRNLKRKILKDSNRCYDGCANWTRRWPLKPQMIRYVADWDRGEPTHDEELTAIKHRKIVRTTEMTKLEKRLELYVACHTLKDLAKNGLL